METENRRIRQSGLISENILHTPITVIGAGGIGSLTTLALAKVGFQHIRVYDYDTVEEHNLPNQFYRLCDVGKYKVEALRNIVEEFEGIEIEGIAEEYTRDSEDAPRGIVISAVDSMKARRMIYESLNKDIIAFIDGRMGGNQLEVYTVRMDSRENRGQYRKTLWDDNDTAQVRCTEKAVMYNVLTIASWITNQVRLVLQGKPVSKTLILDLENMILIRDELVGVAV